MPLFTVTATAAVIGNKDRGRYARGLFGEPLRDATGTRIRIADPEPHVLVAFIGVVYVRVFEDIPSRMWVGPSGSASETKTSLWCLYMTTPYSSERGFGVAKCILRD